MKQVVLGIQQRQEEEDYQGNAISLHSVISPYGGYWCAMQHTKQCRD